MTNGDEVSITCGEAASIVDRIRGFLNRQASLVSTLVLTLRPTGLLPLVTDSLPVRLLPDRAALRYADPQPGYHPWRRSGHQRPAVGSAAYRYHGAAGGPWERWTVCADRPQSFPY
ncbi:hypothetical protein LNQ52_13505 [Klebsiella pneumoniae subsp. pneumoniae]|nr:hypothetical protein [Klebsiella pneumoniae subsp. pneumoniae]